MPPPESSHASGLALPGSGDSSPESKWTNFAFWKACFDDLITINFPTPKNVAQTVVISQIAFVAIFFAVLVFDAFAEATARSLIQGKAFNLILDGSASPSRGM